MDEPSDLETRVTAPRFDATAAGQQTIVGLLTRLIDEPRPPSPN